MRELRLARLLPVLGLLLAAGGCGYYQRDSDALRGPVPAGRDLELWSGGHAYLVHNVTVGTDSVRGTLDLTYGQGDSLVVFARSAVDSVKVRKHAPGATIALVAMGTLAMGLLALWGMVTGPNW